MFVTDVEKIRASKPCVRNYRMDNIRFILIFLVVLGHLLDLSYSPKLMYLNEIIYSFHMPAFVFLTGCFAKNSPRKVAFSYLYPYCLLQILYVLFYRYYIGQYQPFQFSLPHYTLWYLLAAAFYLVLVPLLQTKQLLSKVIIFAVSVTAALASGFDAQIEYLFTASRFFCFLPYFVAGYFWGHRACGESLCAGLSRKLRIVLAVVVAALLILFELVILKSERVSLTALYHAGSYSATGITWMHRLFLLVVGFAWIAFFLLAVPNRKMFLITGVGKNTLAIYMLHGFLVKVIFHIKLLPETALAHLGLSVVTTLAIVLIFGNPVAAFAAKWCLTGHWIQVLLNKIPVKKACE